MGEQIFGFNKSKTARTNYSFKGRHNKSAFPKQFIKICKFGQRELKAYLSLKLTEFYDTKDITVGDGYIYAKGDMPVCLTAHMDTVHKAKVKDYYGYYDKKNKRNIISSPQGIGGDDRCGVYMIMNILQTTSYRPSIIFCEDEEMGGIGSGKFVRTEYIRELEDMKFFVELDRANGNDLVFYDDINTEFHEWCEQITNYTENYGSFSDISELCPAAGVSGVNISCGYYNAHTTDEYVVLEEMMKGIKATKKLLKASKELESSFEYKEYYSSKWYKSWYEGDYDYYKSYANSQKSDTEIIAGDIGELKDNRTSVFNDYGDLVGILFTFNEGKSAEYYGWTEEDCLGQFIKEHPHISYNEIEDIELIY